MTHKVIVVGGGYAGVAAATALAGWGYQVDLLESRGSLGGRAYSIAPSENFPAPADNGPHLFMGCYHETLRLFERLEVPHPFHWIDPLQLSWFTPGGKSVRLKCAALPAPFHLAWGLLTSNAFPFGEKISLTRALSFFSKKPFTLAPEWVTVAQFLEATKQGPAARERFWVPLTQGVMNLSPTAALIHGLGEVLHRMFFSRCRDSAMAVAAKPLSGLAFPLVPPFLQARSGAVHFHEGVQAFKVSGHSFEVTGRSGKTYGGDALVWAVPPSSLAALWPPGTWDKMENLRQLGKSPIISVHLILSKAVMVQQLAGLSGANFEWVFNRNSNWNGSTEGQYLSLTASAADEWAHKSDKELVALAFGELQERCLAARNAVILHSKVTREMAATFIWNRETDGLRPPCETPFPGVFLAGDWTDTGLPATIEGACLSGHRAAEKVKAYLAGNH